MFNRCSSKSVICGALILAASFPAAHAMSYTATGAGGHVIWFQNGLTQENEFNPAGTFIENFGTGTAVLSGTAYEANGIDGFTIQANFSGYVPNSSPDSTSDAPSGSPKIEFDGSDSGNWHYYTTTTGTLTGVGTFAGQDFTFERMGPAFQVGNGANGKNSNFGASGWLTIFDATGASLGQGDFNIDLEEDPNIPGVPDAGSASLLLGLSLATLGVAHRRLRR